MKKSLLIALTGLMLFAFTQCSGNDSNKDGDKKGTVKNDAQNAGNSDKTADFNEQASGIEGLGGTEQFNDNVKLFKGMIEAIDESDNCEDLNNNLMAAVFMAWAYANKEYASDQLMTEDEQKQLEKISEECTKAIEKKQKELGCEEDLEENNDLELDSLLFDDDFDLDFDLDDDEDDDEDDDF